MRALLLNSVCGIRSTGRICTQLAQELEEQGHEVKIAFGREKTVPEQFQKYAVPIGCGFDVKMHALRTRLLDDHGFGSRRATKKFLEWADAYDPALLWLHNIHGYYINIELLFDWIKSRPQMQVCWTLHDCWAFTGHCTYFTAAKCERWRTGCRRCSQKGRYPASVLLDNSRGNYSRKKDLFTGVRSMKLITPSGWLAGLVRQSFLREYPVEVRYNAIDTETFKPTAGNFRRKYGLEDKKLILGVASVWDERKGLQDFFRLARALDDSYALILVGASDAQMRRFESNMIGIRKTNHARELAEIYTAADVFFNPTYEDNYPTVNLEAQACGTPVVTYDSGGSAETLHTAESVSVRSGALEESICLLKQICERSHKG
ncbi:MAG: glycosyltransferase [Oscillibacter sp.]|nr:glycosyltransferase [Oscillibacter sp.]